MRRAAALAALGMLAIGCARPSEGMALLEVHVFLDPDCGLGGAQGDLSGVTVRRADRSWDEPWIALEPVTSVVSLPYAETKRVARGEVPPGAYRHVFVDVEAPQAHPDPGQWVEMADIVEPIAAPIDLRAGQHAILTVEWTALTDASGAWSLYAKNTTVR